MDREKDLKIKVCGLRDPLNLEQVCALLPEFVGFIFYPRSKRFVGTRPDPVLFEIPGPDIKKVGVFVDEDLKRVREIVSSCKLDAVQLHGRESAEYCRQLSSEAVEVIKALDPQLPFFEFERYMEVVDLLLFDSGGAGKGGTGQKFDWELLKSMSLPFPFLLSGGIGSGDAGPIQALDLMGLTGVDVNSKFELSPGLKDIDQLKDFFIEIRK